MMVIEGLRVRPSSSMHHSIAGLPGPASFMVVVTAAYVDVMHWDWEGKGSTMALCFLATHTRTPFIRDKVLDPYPASMLSC